MVELVDHLLKGFLQDHEVHDHPLFPDITLELEPDNVGMTVESGALLVPGYEVACREPNARITTVYV